MKTVRTHVKELYAWLAVDPETQEEGIAAAIVGKAIYLPLVGTKLQTMAGSVRREAERIKQESGCPRLTLVRFSMREDLEELP